MPVKPQSTVHGVNHPIPTLGELASVGAPIQRAQALGPAVLLVVVSNTGKA